VSLPDVTGDLGATIPQGGHLVSAYAVGVVVGAPVPAVLSARLPAQGPAAGPDGRVHRRQRPVGARFPESGVPIALALSASA
jgi:hypothetical protein